VDEQQEVPIGSEEQLISCQVVRRKSDLALVEWEQDGAPKRAWATPSMVVEQVENSKSVVVRNPDEGVPYGERWQDLLPNPQVTPETIDRELKRRGIWTIDDLQANPNLARTCLQRAYGLDLGVLLTAASRKQKSDGGNS